MRIFILRKSCSFVLIVLCVLLASCTIKMTSYSVISTHNLEMSNFEDEPKVSAMECTYDFIIPLGKYWNDEQDAINSAIDQAGSDYVALANPKITFYNQQIVVGRTCMKAEGVAIKLGDLRLSQESKQ